MSASLRCLDFLAALLVVLGVRLGVLAHLLDLVLAEAAAGGDGDLLFLAGAQVLGADVQDAVGVDVEGHFDLRHAARRGRDVRQVELADGLVVAGQLAFALQDVNLHARLIVRGGGENFRFAGGNGRVALDELGEHAAQRLDAERQRRHVEQQHVLDFALEHAALNGRADGHHFVRVHALVRRSC